MTTISGTSNSADMRTTSRVWQRLADVRRLEQQVRARLLVEPRVHLAQRVDRLGRDDAARDVVEDADRSFAARTRRAEAVDPVGGPPLRARQGRNDRRRRGVLGQVGELALRHRGDRIDDARRLHVARRFWRTVAATRPVGGRGLGDFRARPSASTSDFGAGRFWPSS